MGDLPRKHGPRGGFGPARAYRTWPGRLLIPPQITFYAKEIAEGGGVPLQVGSSRIPRRPAPATHSGLAAHEQPHPSGDSY
jgi:hypothetical protein